MNQEWDGKRRTAVACSLDIFLFFYFYLSPLAGKLLCASVKKKSRV